MRHAHPRLAKARRPANGQLRPVPRVNRPRVNRPRINRLRINLHRCPTAVRSSGPSLQTNSRARMWWIVAAVFVIGMIALPIGDLVLYRPSGVAQRADHPPCRFPVCLPPPTAGPAQRYQAQAQACGRTIDVNRDYSHGADNREHHRLRHQREPHCRLQPEHRQHQRSVEHGRHHRALHTTLGLRRAEQSHSRFEPTASRPPGSATRSPTAPVRRRSSSPGKAMSCTRADPYTASTRARPDKPDDNDDGAQGIWRQATTVAHTQPTSDQ